MNVSYRAMGRGECLLGRDLWGIPSIPAKVYLKTSLTLKEKHCGMANLVNLTELGITQEKYPWAHLWACFQRGLTEFCPQPPIYEHSHPKKWDPRLNKSRKWWATLVSCSFLTTDKMWPAVAHSCRQATSPPSGWTIPSNCQPTSTLPSLGCLCQGFCQTCK